MTPSSFPRILVLAGTLVGCTIIAIYVGFLLHISVIYTYLFYIPIVLGGLWYPSKGVFIALYLGILHLSIEFGSTGILEISVVARSISFLAVAIIIGYIAGRMQMKDRASLEYLSSYAQRIRSPRSRIQSTFDGIRMSLGMDMDIERMWEKRDTAGLIRALEHQNTEVRYQAAKALGTLHDPSSVNRLAKALRDPDCGVRWKAAEALGKIGDPAVPFLIDALQDPTADIRWRAALALGDTIAAEAIPALIIALRDEDRYVRERAIIALASFHESALISLSQALNREDERIRAGAVRALGLLGKPATELLLHALQKEKDAIVLSALEEAFVDMGRESVKPLHQILEGSKDTPAQEVAIRVLNRWKIFAVTDGEGNDV
ncbi:MAG: HEAT repeat domain-containing protein [Methanomicrobiales archaeon]|nr:HEAT repeat domain-containing protein [Methanomicrobiales archaeon]